MEAIQFSTARDDANVSSFACHFSYLLPLVRARVVAFDRFVRFPCAPPSTHTEDHTYTRMCIGCRWGGALDALSLYSHIS